MAGMEAEAGIFGDDAGGTGDLDTQAEDRDCRIIGQGVPGGQVGGAGGDRGQAHDVEIGPRLHHGADRLAERETLGTGQSRLDQAHREIHPGPVGQAGAARIARDDGDLFGGSRQRHPVQRAAGGGGGCRSQNPGDVEPATTIVEERQRGLRQEVGGRVAADAEVVDATIVTF